MDNYKRLSLFNCGLITNITRDIHSTSQDCSEKLKEEARLVDLEVICKSTKTNYNLYRFVDCGHTSYLQGSHVRMNSFKCNTCYLSHLISVADQLGDIFVCRTTGVKQLSIRQCGHVSETNSPHKRGITERKMCVMCATEAINSTAEKNGYEILSSSAHMYKEIRFLICGHTKLVQLSQIHKGNVVCRVCKASRHLSKVSEYGLELISFETEVNTYRLPCGCINRIEGCRAERGEFSCRNCYTNFYSEPSSIYLIKITQGDFSWLKLGYSKSMNTRFNNYGLQPNSFIDLITSVSFDTGYSALAEEKRIHRKYKHERLHPDLMKTYHVYSGYTECYPIEMKDELIAELNREGRHE